MNPEAETTKKILSIPLTLALMLSMVAFAGTSAAATVFTFDPDGGIVGFRISSYRGDGTLLYYADPTDLSGAPAEPFSFDADPSIPPELKTLPREADHVRIESTEFFTDESGDTVRFLYRYVGLTEDETYRYYCVPLQDGIEMVGIWNTSTSDEEEDMEEDPELLHVYSCRLRTGNPAVLVVFEEGDATDTPVAA